MNLRLTNDQEIKNNSTVTLTGSKSETNRLYILKHLFPELVIQNDSDSDDSHHLSHALRTTDSLLDIGHAGTAMRFLTALLAFTPDKQITLTGSDRMKQRPIGILVDALRTLGAKIEYEENEGYPPLKISGQNPQKNTVTINAGVSSQYITALLLTATKFKNGLEINFEGELTSRPYIAMTVQMLLDLGVQVTWERHINVKNNITETIKVLPLEQLKNAHFTVESDWSSAGYWYSWIALQSPGKSVTLKYFKESSLQGDSALAAIYENFSVETRFENEQIILTKTVQKLPDTLTLDLTEQPDQAQTVFCTCLGLGIQLHLTGLHTLRIKETDRIEALRLMGLRFRESVITATQDTLTLNCKPMQVHDSEVVIDTFNDHRMALAFAPLALKTPLIINDADVVTKSYGSFWNDLKEQNLSVKEI